MLQRVIACVGYNLKGWLEQLSVNSRRSYKRILLGFFQYVGVSPEEAVAWQRVHSGDYRFVDLTYKWLKQSKLAAGTKRFRTGMIRGYFLFYRVPLPTDKHRFSGDKPRVVGCLTVEELRKILHSCDVKRRAAFLLMFQSGSGVGELIYINHAHARLVFNAVRKEQRIIRLEMPGRKQAKNIRPYYTFIGGDAVDALAAFFHSRGWRRDAVLFRSDSGRVLSKSAVQNYFKSHAFMTGVNTRVTPSCPGCGSETVRRHKRHGKVFYTCISCGVARHVSEMGFGASQRSGVRYGAHPHELRDLFRTEWHRSGADPSVGEHLLGHKIDGLGYDKIMRDHAYARAEYCKALPFLNILSEDPRVVPRGEVDGRLGVLENRLREMDLKYAKLSEIASRVFEKDQAR